jgi:hypothetical protein
MKLAPHFLALVLGCSAVSAADISIEKSTAGAVVKIDGQLFTEYVTKSETKPILYPIIGPTGKKMTRDYPMVKTEGEDADHPHHRSLWFAYDKVNDTNFWAEPASFGTSKKDTSKELAELGTQQHRAFSKLEGGKDKGTIVSITDWLTGAGKKLLEDERRITFSATADIRIIDFDIDLKATEGDVHFGDSKEGVFGIRVPSSMDVEQKVNKGAEPGHIISSEGLADAAAWGKPAAWVDYHGNVGGEHLGIAILNHPSSFRYPTPWHVRTYGLFAANCFGLKAFDKNAQPGDHTLPKGQTLKFSYRVVLHTGDAKSAKIADLFASYAKEAK